MADRLPRSQRKVALWFARLKPRTGDLNIGYYAIIANVLVNINEIHIKTVNHVFIVKTYISILLHTRTTIIGLKIA